MLGLRIGPVNYIWNIEYDLTPYNTDLESIQGFLDQVDTLVGFNLKFDLAWLRRYGLNFDHCTMWDCQLGEFVHTNQQERLPSLEGCLSKYGLGHKLDIVKTEYWERGIDTPNVPWDILEEYLVSDLELTDKLYKWQLDNIPKSKRNLLKLQNKDLVVLLEMEGTGLLVDWQGLSTAAQARRLELEETLDKLRDFTGDWPYFNPDSPEHISALLYGGSITAKVSTEYEHTYKTGPKKGTVVPRNRWHEETKDFTRLVAPLKGSELKKEGLWSTDEPTLRQLPKPKKLIDLLLHRAALTQLLGTYYDGFTKIYTDMDWRDDVLHGTLNMCIARTSRLSASKPNQQNIAEEIFAYIRSRG